MAAKSGWNRRELAKARRSALPWQKPNHIPPGHDLAAETSNIEQPTSSCYDAGKLGSSALDVECSMFVREISRHATIWTDGDVAAGILPPDGW
jgi:hypothetical protein